MAEIIFRYGSKPKREFPAEQKVPGGRLGGHIYLKTGEFFYGFEPAEYDNLHIFPSKKKNAKYTKERREVWCQKEYGNKLLSIKLPFSQGQEIKLKKLLEQYHNLVPYDYAVLGMRCGSSTHHLLSQIHFFHPVPRFLSWLIIPTPHFLRAWFILKAKRNHWEITLKPGNSRRIWEKDW